MNRRADRAAAAAVVVLATLVACRSPKIPQAPSRETPPELAALQQGGPTALRPYLDAYPLGELGSRTDLLAANGQHSMHLLQARRAIARYYRPTRAEILYVLAGTGTCYVGDKSYPITPGATFRIPPGVVRSHAPDEGRTIVAVAYFEPPLPDGADDRVTVR